MKLYSDATQRVLERTLLILQETLPADSIQVIRMAIEQGKFQSVKEVLEAILEGTDGKENNADQWN